MSIIGIAGRARAGKSTLARYLCGNFGWGEASFAAPLKRFAQEVFAFSDEQVYGDKKEEPDKRYPRSHGPVGEYECPCCGVSGEELSTTPCYLTPRYALKTLGSEWGRNCYLDIWAELGARQAKAQRETVGRVREALGAITGVAPAVVFDDVRFANEAKAIKAAGGKLILLTRNVCRWCARVMPPPGTSRQCSDAGVCEAPPPPTHVSEIIAIPFELFDASIVNEGTFEELYAKGEEAIR